VTARVNRSTGPLPQRWSVACPYCRKVLSYGVDKEAAEQLALEHDTECPGGAA
jgi:hypothetical protein